MDYVLIYNNIIEKASGSNRIKGDGTYYEKHHIVPKCMGGSNDPCNIVLLTAREHYVCHKLLVEIYPYEYKLRYAYMWMCTSRNGMWHERDYVVTAREYERARCEISNIWKGSQHPNKGRKFSEEHKEKIRQSRIGKRLPRETIELIASKNRGKKRPLDAIARTAARHTGMKRSPEAIERIKLGQPNRKGENSPMFGRRGENNPLYGRSKPPLSEEIKKKISDSWELRPVLICEHCGFESKSKMNLDKWHNDNCRFKESPNPKIKCPFCDVESFGYENMKRYHFDNCKNKKHE